MNKREVLLIGVAIVAIVVIGILMRQKKIGQETGTIPGQQQVYPEGTSPTRTPVDADVPVPEQGATDIPENVAPPVLVSKAAPAVDYSFRSFTITVENGVFVPDTVIAREKDTISLKITSADGTYDFYQPDYALSTQLPKGQTKMVEFGGLLTGKLTFYCKSCGGPESGPVGYIVVVPQEE